MFFYYLVKIVLDRCRYLWYTWYITLKKGNNMLDKIIDALGYTLIGFLVIYAVFFYATELIRIIS